MSPDRKHTPEQVERKLQDDDKLLAQGEGVAAVCRRSLVS